MNATRLENLVAENIRLINTLEPGVEASLNNGLSETEIAALSAEFSLALPEPVRCLYQIYNGAKPESWQRQIHFPGSYSMMPLRQALEAYQEAQDDPSYIYAKPGQILLPLATNYGGDFYCWNLAETEPSIVHVLPDAAMDDNSDLYSDVFEMLEIENAFLREGGLYYDPVDEIFTTNLEKLSEIRGRIQTWRTNA